MADRVQVGSSARPSWVLVAFVWGPNLPLGGLSGDVGGSGATTFDGHHCQGVPPGLAAHPPSFVSLAVTATVRGCASQWGRTLAAYQRPARSLSPHLLAPLFSLSLSVVVGAFLGCCRTAVRSFGVPGAGLCGGVFIRVLLWGTWLLQQVSWHRGWCSRICHGTSNATGP